MANQYAGRFYDALLNTSSKLLKDTEFNVYVDAATTTLATLYTDRTKTVAFTAQPITDAEGMAEFFAVPGDYYVQCGTLVRKVTVYEDLSDTADVALVNEVSAALADEVVDRINADTDTLEAAQGYADTVGTNTLSEAEDYADEVAGSVSTALAALDGAVLKKSGSAQSSSADTNFTGALQVGSQPVATQAYADSVAQGLVPLDAVRLATAAALPANTRTGNVLTASANGALADIDGETPALNDPILVKNEATAANNGIYIVTVLGDGSTPFQLTRRSDFDSDSEVVSGKRVIIDDGDTHAGASWFLDTPNPITLNTTALTWKRFTGATEVIAGDHLERDGNVLNVLTGSGELATETYVDTSSALNEPRWTVTEVLQSDWTAEPFQVVRFPGSSIRTLTLPHTPTPPDGAMVAVRITEAFDDDKLINVQLQGGATFTTTTGATQGQLVLDYEARVYVYSASDNTWTYYSGFIPSVTLNEMMGELDTAVLESARTFAIAQAKKVIGEDNTEYYVKISDTGTMSVDPLKYERPDFTSYNVYQFTDKTHYTKNGGASLTFSGELTLGSTEDAVIYFPTSVAMGRAGGVRISSGRHVAIMGGEINIDSTVFPDPQTNGDPPTTDYRGIYFLNQTGNIWIEGLWIHGTRLGDALNVSHGNTNTCIFTIENCLIGDVEGGGGTSANSIAHSFGGIETGTGINYTEELHADCLQFFSTATANLANVQLRIHNTIWRTAYQGLLVNQNLGLGVEAENFIIDQQTTTYWNGEVRTGYPIGIFSGSSNAPNMNLDFGPGCQVYFNSGSTKTYAVSPEDHPDASFLPVTKDPYEHPTWMRGDYGRTYEPSQRLELIADSGTVARLVNAGSDLSTARPVVNGKVIWTATGEPVNAQTGDIIVEHA